MPETMATIGNYVKVKYMEDKMLWAIFPSIQKNVYVYITLIYVHIHECEFMRLFYIALAL